MAISMAVFMFAGLLLLVALTGGGFEVKELKVPKVGRTSRIASFACSLIVLLLGIHLERRPAAAAPAVAESKPQKSVEAPAPPPAPQIIVLARTPEELGLTVPRPSSPLAPPAPAAVSQPDLSAPTAAPGQEVRSETPVVKRPAKASAASSKTKKRVPWEQRPRRFLQRFKNAAR